MCQAPLTHPRCQANLTCMQNDVRERRGARGLSQGDLGKALGVSRQTINAIETGRYLPSLPLAIALARYFEANVEDIFLAENGDLR
jgi:putative transcriptional regulator